MNEENVINRAEVVLAVRGYETLDVFKKENLVDYVVSHQNSDDKILVRVIFKTPSKTGYIGIGSVNDMSNLLEKRDYVKGVLVGKGFTESAIKEIKKVNIEMISDTCRPLFTSNRLFSLINDYTQKLCKVKCGQIPLRNSDCQGYVDGHYSCEVRLTSDNADFHFEHGWVGFLEMDLMKLLTIEKSTTQLTS